jgi:hypothetical protein
MATPNFTAAQLRELVSYDAGTGQLTALTDSICGKGRIIRAAGGALGRLNDQGYLLVMVLGREYRAHRLAWLYANGSWPEGQIDHINGIRADNRLANLRLADQTLNSENLRKARSDNKSGFLGVLPNRKRWAAQIGVDGKQIHIGTFDTPELAHQAYLAAKRKLHAGCTI